MFSQSLFLNAFIPLNKGRKLNVIIKLLRPVFKGIFIEVLQNGVEIFETKYFGHQETGNEIFTSIPNW